VAPRKDTRYLKAGSRPGELLQKIHRTGSERELLYRVKEGLSHDQIQAEESIGKLVEFDAAENVFVLLAYDATLIEHLNLYPKRSNEWLQQDLARKTRWLFTGDSRRRLGRWRLRWRVVLLV